MITPSMYASQVYLEWDVTSARNTQVATYLVPSNRRVIVRHWYAFVTATAASSGCSIQFQVFLNNGGVRRVIGRVQSETTNQFLTDQPLITLEANDRIDVEFFNTSGGAERTIGSLILERF